MPSLNTKYAFNFAVTAILLSISQLPISTSGLSKDTTSSEIDDERVLTINLLLCKKNMRSLVENDVEAPWTANNIIKGVSNLQPRSTKRNLEHLAKSSGGYLRIQNDNGKDKKDEISPMTKIISDIIGKHKRGVYTLAKNGDFPQKNLKPNVKEVAVTTYKFVQKSLDYNDST